MSASQELQIQGGPVQSITTAVAELRTILKPLLPDAVTLEVTLLAMRRVVGQAVLDGYSAGRQDALRVLPPGR